jgi:uncharacterized protein YdhG (YjbR/CyaY superfamily)
MKHVYDKGFRYTPVAEQGVDYLRQRFAQIRAEIEANKREAEEKVSTIKPKLKARTA